MRGKLKQQEKESGIPHTYLNRLLSCAITHHSKPTSKQRVLPDRIKSVSSGIAIFRRAIEFETHIAMRESVEGPTQTTTLHAVDLETPNPGIVSDSRDMLTVYRHGVSSTTRTRASKVVASSFAREENRLQKLATKRLEQETRNLKKSTLDKALKATENAKERTHLKREFRDDLSKLREIQKQKTKKNQDTKANAQKPKETDSNTQKPKESDSNAQKPKENDSNAQKPEENQATPQVNQATPQENVDSREIERNPSPRRQLVDESMPRVIESTNDRIPRHDAIQADNTTTTTTTMRAKDSVDLKKHRKTLEKITGTNKRATTSGVNNTVGTYEQTKLENIRLYANPATYSRYLVALSSCSFNHRILDCILDLRPCDRVELIHGPPGTGKTHQLVERLRGFVREGVTPVVVMGITNVAVINLYRRARAAGIAGSLALSNPNLAGSSIPASEKLSWTPYDDIVYCTVSGRNSYHLKKRCFKAIMLDEAAMCPEAYFWGTVREETEHIVMAGDPMQLPAFVSQEGRTFQYGRSFMERALTHNFASTFLSTQHRMHPEIVKFPNTEFYRGELETSYSDPPFNVQKPFAIFDVDGKESRRGTSYENDQECDVIQGLLGQLLKNSSYAQLEIVVLVPYAAQLALMKSKLSGHRAVVTTIDAFQGNEADVVFVSMVRTTGCGFWSDSRRLNVALTRARHMLRLVGCCRALRKDPSLGRMISDARQRGLVEVV